MEAAHIIPFIPNKFDNSATNNPEFRQVDAARTWDMLHSWTRIDLESLLRQDINSPINAIYMTSEEHTAFGNSSFIWIKTRLYTNTPNKYKFRTGTESTVAPPNPEFLKIHAAFAKVLNLCGAAEYIESVERDAEIYGALCPNGETDLSSLLMSLAIMAH
ncbi:hypothetical protein NLJ89_g3262 [Agrocybe chaxingu]|uniref:HNH nuclease domain-containing protein n=1 Tax=Agrocybe chaxingu TaxID=84603 RepID=A0A9W8KBB0_9AGAR|nr:hypothetical protein NLJ89_g3262 [Agrocybe chaxingu]